MGYTIGFVAALVAAFHAGRLSMSWREGRPVVGVLLADVLVIFLSAAGEAPAAWLCRLDALELGAPALLLLIVLHRRRRPVNALRFAWVSVGMLSATLLLVLLDAIGATCALGGQPDGVGFASGQAFLAASPLYQASSLSVPAALLALGGPALVHLAGRVARDAPLAATARIVLLLTISTLLTRDIDISAQYHPALDMFPGSFAG